MIPTNLIQDALILTWKTMEDMNELTPEDYPKVFSIEKFCYYLISREFILLYFMTCNLEISTKKIEEFNSFMISFIQDFQTWNPKPLISLLEKIWKK